MTTGNCSTTVSSTSPWPPTQSDSGEQARRPYGPKCRGRSALDHEFRQPEHGAPLPALQRRVESCRSPDRCSFSVPAGTSWARRRHALCRRRMKPSLLAPPELMRTEPIQPICAIADGGPSSVTDAPCAAPRHSVQPPLRRSSRLLPSSTSRHQWSIRTVRRAAGSLRECRRSRCHGRWG